MKDIGLHLMVKYIILKAIQDELKKLGHKFFSKTDTEVILKAYIEWGESCFHKFNGMWSLAILDTKTKDLFLVRDRLGIKPLYFYNDGINFIFSSEIKGNSNSSNFYLSTKGLIEEDLKNLRYKNINILRPGHIITNKEINEIGFLVWVIDILFKLVNPFLKSSLRKYRGIPLERVSEFMANEEMAGTKIFYYDDFIK